MAGAPQTRAHTHTTRHVCKHIHAQTPSQNMAQVLGEKGKEWTKPLET